MNRIIFLFLSFLFLELVFRLLGIHSFDYASKQEINDLFKQVNNRSFFIPHELLGYKLDTGKYIIPMDDKSFFTALNDSQGFRNNDKTKSGEKVHLYGCSIAYGVCVEDEDVFSNRLNQMDSERQYLNFGVPSYSMVQSFLLFKNNIEKGNIPQDAIFLYGSFHDERNAMSRSWLKNIYRKDKEFVVPYGTLTKNNEIEIKYKSNRYNGLRLCEISALVNLIDDKVNSIYARKNVEITIPLFKKVLELSREYKINFVLCVYNSDEATEDLVNYMKSENVEVIDFSSIMEDSLYSCLPKDGHPNERAHKAFAYSIYSNISVKYRH